MGESRWLRRLALVLNSAISRATLAAHIFRWQRLFDELSKNARLLERWCHTLAGDTPYDGFTFGFKAQVEDCQLATLAVIISGFKSKPVIEAADLSWYPSGYQASFVDDSKPLTGAVLRRFERWLLNAKRLVCKFDERQVHPRILGRVVPTIPVQPLRYANKFEGNIWSRGLASVLRDHEISSIALVNTTWSGGPPLLKRLMSPEMLDQHEIRPWKYSIEALTKALPIRLRRSYFTSGSFVIRFVSSRIFLKEPRFFYKKEPHCQGVISFHPVGICETGTLCSTIISKSFLISNSNPETFPCNWLCLFSKDGNDWRLEGSFDLSRILALSDPWDVGA